MRKVWILGVVLLMLGVRTPTAGEKAKKVHGRVSAVTADAITIAQGIGAVTIVCDSTTQIERNGRTTATHSGDAVQHAPVVEPIAVGDNVSVIYRESGGRLHAK